ncbi:MAG: hypothetical protein OXJ37_15540 [Bryobacterales bacterium]|nr:hypothetical protein [Bryobacterales bacterium]MDE0263814.1 hypothetical protein [Bryobacterales bacterium]MDE0620459.1 hypothetical protein [Bryobacterales bacterium]
MPARVAVALTVALAIGCGGKGARDYPPYHPWETPALDAPRQFEAAAEAEQYLDKLEDPLPRPSFDSTVDFDQ